MQILTNAQLEELEQDLEKKQERKLEAEKTRVKNLRRDVTALKKTIKKMEQDKKTLQEKHATEIDKLKRKQDIELEKLTDKVEYRDAKIAALKDKVEASKKIASQVVELENREALLAARESAQGETEKVVKDLRKRADEAEETGYRKGYGDGVADGLREAHKITAEDRKMAMQIAALAAASHTPAAAKDLASRVLNDVTKQLSSSAK